MELARTVAEKPPIAARLAKQAVLAAEETGLSTGLENERRLYELAMATEDRVEGMKAFLEKREPRVQGTLKVERVGVVGAGTMGVGIAQIACLGGYETRLHDPIPTALEGGIERTRAALAKGAERGRWSAEDAEAASARVGAAANLADLAGCDLVIEAAPEDLGLKRELFAALADACGPETILATNTSSLPVTAIGAAVPHPERVVGMHFFNPPALMKLVEVVATADSSDEALDATTEVGRRMGRTPIRAKDSPGFIANRLARPFSLESLRMLADGVADARDDRPRLPARRRLPDGPVRADRPDRPRRQPQRRPLLLRAGRRAGRWRPSAIQERMVVEGSLGRKTGEGFYAYGEATPAPTCRARATTTRTLHSGGADARPGASWRGSTPPPRRSSPASSPRSPTRPPSPSRRRSARPTTWTRRCGSASTGRSARSSSPS